MSSLYAAIIAASATLGTAVLGVASTHRVKDRREKRVLEACVRNVDLFGKLDGHDEFVLCRTELAKLIKLQLTDIFDADAESLMEQARDWYQILVNVVVAGLCTFACVAMWKPHGWHIGVFLVIGLLGSAGWMHAAMLSLLPNHPYVLHLVNRFSWPGRGKDDRPKELTWRFVNEYIEKNGMPAEIDYFNVSGRKPSDGSQS